jgi:hypothetical protein
VLAIVAIGLQSQLALAQQAGRVEAAGQRQRDRGELQRQIDRRLQRAESRIRELESQKQAAAAKTERDLRALGGDASAAWRKILGGLDRSPEVSDEMLREYLTDKNFGRNRRRDLAANKEIRRLLESAQKRLEAKKLDAAARRVALAEELELAASLSYGQNTEALVGSNLRMRAYRLPRWAGERLPVVGRPLRWILDHVLQRTLPRFDKHHGVPGEEGLDHGKPGGNSPIWRQPDPAAVIAPPSLPAPDAVLKLTKIRDRDANGIHPSAEVTTRVPDPARPGKLIELEGTVKAPDDLSVQVEPTMARYLRRLGLSTPEIHPLRDQRVEPQVALAMFRYRKKVLGVMVDERTPILGRLLPSWQLPRQVGLPTRYKMASYVRDIKLRTEQRPLEGERAVAYLKKAARKPDLLANIEYVTMRALQLKADDPSRKTVGRWSPDGKTSIHRWERALLALVEVMFGANDIKVDNLSVQLVQAEKKGEKKTVRIEKAFSDVGGMMDLDRPERFAAPIERYRKRINSGGKRFLVGGNNYYFKALDSVTPTEWRAALRLMAAVPIDAWLADVEAGVFSPTQKQQLKKGYIQRRNYLLEEFLPDEVKAGTLRLWDADGHPLPASSAGKSS